MTARYDSKDRPFFEAKVKALCSDCQVLASNANTVVADAFWSKEEICTAQYVEACKAAGIL